MRFHEFDRNSMENHQNQTLPEESATARFLGADGFTASALTSAIPDGDCCSNSPEHCLRGGEVEIESISEEIFGQ